MTGWFPSAVRLQEPSENVFMGEQGDIAQPSDKDTSPVLPDAKKPRGSARTGRIASWLTGPPKHLLENLKLHVHELEHGHYGRSGHLAGLAFPSLSGLHLVHRRSREAYYEAKTQKILVKWDDLNDPEHMLKKSFVYRLYITVLCGFLKLCTSFVSSGPSMVIPQMMEEYGTTKEVVKSSNFLFVASFCVAPLLWAPLSEMFGRRIIIISFTGFVCFNVGCMLAPTIASMIVFRILADRQCGLCAGSYTAFIYGTVYFLFDAYPAVFMGIYHFRPGAVGLAFMGFECGLFLGAFYCLFVDQPVYKKQYEANGNRPLPPEIRLRPALVGFIVLTVAFFWFAAASFPSVSFWCAIVAGCFVAMGIFLVFLCLLTYITEVYLVNAASALAANTVVRSAFGCGFPMFGEQMYDTLKPRYASVILGFIALAMVPIPFVFDKYGDRIRALSRNAPGHHDPDAEASEAPPTGADQA
ncbi:hypothetical protein MEQU1_003182 [Malassezia equina]|uniref:Uncharacterized protein n=1 Tax=Malassezia equina TaxID=1381935 RepID=A0AAF0EF00_9BASI|nr:hypothetical protein MEQU1_003182 [Malassezia equina]